jgi:general stress protein YciG
MLEDETRPKSTRGFASMDAAKQREIASKGGQSVPPEKRSFSQNPQLAAAAGRKGGLSVSNADRSFSRNRRLAAEAGRKGGSQSGGQSQKRPATITKEPPRTGRDDRNNNDNGDLEVSGANWQSGFRSSQH